jgi:hypothetical protein
MTITEHKFEGDITVYSTVKGFPGPKVVKATCHVTCTQSVGSSYSIQMADFQTDVLRAIKMVTLPGQTPMPVHLRISIPKGGQGTFDAGNRQLTLNCEAHFQLMLGATDLILPNMRSVLELALHTGQADLPVVNSVEGSPVDAGSGDLVLVGSDTLLGGYADLRENQCGMVVKGRLNPPLP